MGDDATTSFYRADYRWYNRLKGFVGRGEEGVTFKLLDYQTAHRLEDVQAFVNGDGGNAIHLDLLLYREFPHLKRWGLWCCQEGWSGYVAWETTGRERREAEIMRDFLIAEGIIDVNKMSVLIRGREDKTELIWGIKRWLVLESLKQSCSP